jgi:hypothetical protein
VRSVVGVAVRGAIETVAFGVGRGVTVGVVTVAAGVAGSLLAGVAPGLGRRFIHLHEQDFPGADVAALVVAVCFRMLAIDLWTHVFSGIPSA